MPPARKPVRRRPAIFDDANQPDTVVVTTIRLGHILTGLVDQLLESFGLTILQFNLLRILYVGDPQFAGLPSGSIGPRLLARVPDVPRLIDRTVKAGLVERAASLEDRRVVLIRLTQKGVDLMEESFPRVVEFHRQLLAPMTTAELATLAAGLKRVLAVVESRDR